MNERDAPLHLSGEAFRRAGHELVDLIAGFLEAMPEGAVNRDESVAELRTLLNSAAPMPERGMDPTLLVREAAASLFEHSLFNGHPSFLGYITSSPAPIGMLGELLATAVNANVGAWRLAPMATEIELQTIRWIAELAGYPSDCAGLLVSGGNMANVVALLAARRDAADWDLRAAGVRPEGAPRLRILATRETHVWLQKAVDMVGLGSESILWIPTDEQQRMDPEQLAQMLGDFEGSGEQAMMVIATAGTVSTGAIDPIGEIADLCEKFGVWMHVDGCYGAFAACTEAAPAELRHLGRADSIALDPHKWLYAPLEAGAVLVRDAESLSNTFAIHPDYYHFAQATTNFVDFGPQNSRGFRALKVWLALRQAGRSGYAKMIGDDIRLSEWLAARIEEHPELQLFTRNLSITTFRYSPAGSTALDDEALNELNQTLLERIQLSGEAFVSNAVIDGRYVLRSCIVNFRTDEAALAAMLDTVLRLGRELHAAGG